MGKEGLEHELVQFSVESLEQIVQKIIDAREAIENFEEQLHEKHYEWQKEIEERRNKNDA